MIKHGYNKRGHKHPLYTKWDGMVQRCTNENHRAYRRYGGRGIEICREWRCSAEAFIEWSIGNGWKDGLQIDRINNDGDYCPENCRFVTNVENMKNRSILTAANKSGYRGVSFCRQTSKWIAYPVINGVPVWLKRWPSKKEALYAINYYIISNELEGSYPIPEFKE